MCMCMCIYLIFLPIPDMFQFIVLTPFSLCSFPHGVFGSICILSLIHILSHSLQANSHTTSYPQYISSSSFKQYPVLKYIHRHCVFSMLRLIMICDIFNHATEGSKLCACNIRHVCDIRFCLVFEQVISNNVPN